MTLKGANSMALNAYLRAQYQDGFVLIEDENDESPYDAGKNVFNAILHMRPCEEHGRLTSLELIVGDLAHTIDWTQLPDNARPIRFKHFQMRQMGEILYEPELMSIDFGYQYTDPSGQNIKVITEVK